jgi:glycosyltransferase involved in cell wall biosynthesis
VRVALLTREFPPDVYGGAGVHVDFLVRELRSLVEVSVACFGGPRDGAVAFEPPSALADANFALQTLGVDLEMAASDAVAGADVVHSHTWYANLGGHLGGLLHGIPHVVTAHSLEPRRPWKLEQLGGGYRVSSWIERAAYAEADAVIAVSNGMRTDVLNCYPFLDPDRVHVVRNGIDTVLYREDPGTQAVRRVGVDPDRPYALFVGRITRQKGVKHLLAAAHHFGRNVQVVLCAGSPGRRRRATIGASLPRVRIEDLLQDVFVAFWKKRVLRNSLAGDASAYLSGTSAGEPPSRRVTTGSPQACCSIGHRLSRSAGPARLTMPRMARGSSEKNRLCLGSRLRAATQVPRWPPAECPTITTRVRSNGWDMASARR